MFAVAVVAFVVVVVVAVVERKGRIEKSGKVKS